MLSNIFFKYYLPNSYFNLLVTIKILQNILSTLNASVSCSWTFAQIASTALHPQTTIP